MPAIAIYALTIAKADELSQLRGDALATLAYVANWRAIFSEKSYWDLFAAPSPLEHTWSLSIEEQFYVLWPLLVTGVGVGLGAGRRGLAWVTGLLLAASVAASVALFDGENTSRVYFGTDSRAAAILAGALFAIVLGTERVLSARVVRALDVLGVAAIALLGVAWFRLDGQDPRLYRGGFWLTEIGCLVIIACGTAGERSWVARALSVRPLVWAGTISYGVYLWHWPVDCVLTPERVHVGRFVLLALRLAATLALSLASYRFVEVPIRARGLRTSHPVLVTLASFLGAFAIVALATRARAVPAPLAGSLPLPAPTSSAMGQPVVWATAMSVDAHTLPPPARLAPGTPRVLVLGDSVSAKLGLAMRFRQDELHAFVAERGVGDCSIMESLTLTRFDPRGHPSPSHGCAASWVTDVAELRPDVTFIVLGGGFFAKMTVAGQPAFACDAPWGEAYAGRLLQLFREMGPAAGKIVMMTAPYPMGRWRYPHVVERVDCFNATIRRAGQAASVPVIDVASHVCPTSDCNLLSEGEPIRPDGLHPDGKGTEELARWTLAGILALPR